MNINNKLFNNDYNLIKENKAQESTIFWTDNIIDNILHYSPNITLCSLSLVNRKFSFLSIKYIRNTELKYIEKIVCFLIQHLNKEYHPEMMNKILFIKNDKKIYGLIDLRQIKLSIDEFEKTVLEALEMLDKKDLEKITNECINIPFSINSLFKLAGKYITINDEIKRLNLTNMGYKKSEFLFNSIKRYLEDFPIHKLIKLANDIEERDLKFAAFEIIVKQLVKIKDFDQAFTLGYYLPDEQRDEIFLLIIQKLIKVGNIDQAHEKANELFLPNCSTDKKNKALRDIAKGLAKKNNIDQAKKIVNEIINISDKDDALVYIIKVLMYQNNIDQAKKTVNEITSAYIKNKALMCIITVLTRQNDSDQLQLILSEIKNPIYQTRCALNIAKILIKNSKLEQALEIVNSILINFSIEQENLKIANKILCAITKFLIEKNNIVQIIELADKISGNDLLYDFISLIIPVLIRENHINKVKELFKSISSNKLSPSLGIDIIEKLIEVDHIDVAKKIAHRIDKPVRSVAYNLIVRALAKKINANQALEFITKYMEGKTWISESLESETFLILIEAFTNEGNMHQAEKVFDHLGRKHNKKLALFSLVKGFVKKERFDQAKSIAYKIADLETLSNALYHIVIGLLNTGRIDQAKEVARTILSKEIRNKAFQDIEIKH